MPLLCSFATKETGIKTVSWAQANENPVQKLKNEPFWLHNEATYFSEKTVFVPTFAAVFKANKTV